jgi:hypothetical protein
MTKILYKLIRNAMESKQAEYSYGLPCHNNALNPPAAGLFQTAIVPRDRT